MTALLGAGTLQCITLSTRSSAFSFFVHAMSACVIEGPKYPNGSG